MALDHYHLTLNPV